VTNTSAEPADLYVNGEPRRAQIGRKTLLLQVMRNQLHLAGSNTVVVRAIARRDP